MVADRGDMMDLAIGAAAMRTEPAWDLVSLALGFVIPGARLSIGLSIGLTGFAPRSIKPCYPHRDRTRHGCYRAVAAR